MRRAWFSCPLFPVLHSDTRGSFLARVSSLQNGVGARKPTRLGDQTRCRPGIGLTLT